MKKMLALLLSLLLIALPALAEPLEEQSVELTYEELEMYLAAIARAAMSDADASVSQTSDGVNVCTFAGGEMIIHITEAIEGLIRSAEDGIIYRMRTTCERPAPLKPGCAADEV